MGVKSSGFFRINHHGDFGAGRISNAVDNLLKPTRHFITVRGFAALSANSGWHILDDYNTAVHIRSKGREPILQSPLAHKTNHVSLPSVLSRFLKSSVHSEGLGTYALISHSSAPFEPQTTCKAFRAFVYPNTKQLGKG